MPSATKLRSWKRPDPRAAIAFCTSRLDWKPEYVLHHLLPVIALWDLRNPPLNSSLKLIMNAPEHDDAVSLLPIRIVKKRTKNFIPCYEVEWKRLGFDVWSLKSGLSMRIIDSSDKGAEDTGNLVNCYRFCVPAVEFQSRYPVMCATFEADTSRSKLRIRRQPASQMVNKKVDNVAQSDGREDLVKLMRELDLRNPVIDTPKGKSVHETVFDTESKSRPKKHTISWNTDSESDLDTEANVDRPGPSADRNSPARSFALRKSLSMTVIADTNEDRKHCDFLSAFHMNSVESDPVTIFPRNFDLHSSLLTPSPSAAKIGNVHLHAISQFDVIESAFDRVKTPASLRERLARMF